MTVADPKQALTAAQVCQCSEPLLQTRASTKWTNERYCERCGLLAPLVWRR